MLKRKWRLVAVAAGSVLIAAGCTMPGDGGDETAQAQPAAAEQESETGPGSDAGGSAGDDAKTGEPAKDSAAGPNTDDIPDPVAEVNGTEVSKKEFVSVFEGQYQQMSMQAQSSGQPVDEEKLKQQSIEGLVGTVLLDQEAEKRGLKASDKEMDESLAEFAKTNKVSTDEFVAKMGEQGMDREAVMDQIEKQIRVDKLIADEYGEYKPTDKEVQAAYDQVAQQQQQMGGAQGGGQQLPPLEQVRPEVEEQIKSEKQAKDMQKMSEKLRKDADVTVHL